LKATDLDKQNTKSSSGCLTSAKHGASGQNAIDELHSESEKVKNL